MRRWRERSRRPSPAETQRHENGLILDTKGKVSQGDILRLIEREGMTIRSFGLYTPSLNDIFISKAGEQA